MKQYIITILCCFVFVTNLTADIIDLNKTDANIIGHVVDKKTGEHLPFVVVALKGTTIGTTTDATGHYFLKNLPEGKFTLEAKYVGYKPYNGEVQTKKGVTLEVNIEIEEDLVSLEEVVVSANRSETSRRLAPTLVNILDVKTFDKTNSFTLADGLNFQPGLRVENDCQNCGFTQVRMNGLDGAYSQILIDSRPIFNSLSGVYGLEQIPANMVDRVEVVRGGGSALFGASAIAGTINIITKEPTRNSAMVSHSLMSIGGSDSFDNNTSFNASIVSDNQRLGIMVFGQKRHRKAYDHDDDGFSEIPELDSRTLGFRAYVKTGTYSKLTFEYHNTNEFRRGGDRLNLPPFQAYIAEQVESDIDAGSVKYDLFSADSKHHFTFYSAAQLTDRKSYYGGGDPAGKLTGRETEEEIENYNKRLNSYGRSKDVTYTLGGQYVYSFDKLLFMPSDFTAGIEYMHDKLNDVAGYREDNIDQKINMKSFFFQNEWKSEQWSFLVGGRLDKHSLLDDVIFSPRANVRYNPTHDINIRLSYGQGFRAPQLFDEDLHVDVSGGELIIRRLSPNLKEEKSHSLSSSVDWYVHTSSQIELNFLLEGFFTKLNDPFKSENTILPSGEIVKTIVNASGAKVYGTNIEARLNYGSLIQLQLGATIQKSRYDKAEKWSGDADDPIKARKRMMRTPDFYGFFVATVNPLKSWTASISGTYTGNMLVPYEAAEAKDRFTKKTSSFFDMNCKVGYEIPFYKGSSLEFNAGVQNIFNAYQKDFDKGADRVSSYVYGPSLPRSYICGAKLTF